jgi:molecular chaperone DnaJ
MKNYYEILEVDINASSEVIDKAYKVLAKKYHPDTQAEDKKDWAEEQFKMLNEAYEVLSDETKRDEYTKQLEFEKNSQLEALMLKNANLEVQLEDLQNELASLKKSSFNNTYSNIKNYYQNANAYYTVKPEQSKTPNNYPETPYTQDTKQQYTKREIYSSRFNSILKNIIAFLITIAIIFFIGFVIWKIPYTHNLLVQLYENNFVIQSIINLFYQ